MELPTVRIFISSPKDVAEERQKAQQVVAELCQRYADRLTLRPILWEELPLMADMSFQEGIEMVLDAHGGIDIAVFILWARLGSPLGKTIRKPDGTEYRSDTEREWDLMRAARAESLRRNAPKDARPKLLAYVRNDEAGFTQSLQDKTGDLLTDAVMQHDVARQFIREQFHDVEMGTNIGAYTSFGEPVTFAHRLRTHLRELLDGMLPDLAAPIWDRAPYQGLEAFDIEHATIFFGREREVCELDERFRSRAQAGCPFVLLVGASGSGKSSLARAGWLHYMLRENLDPSVQRWLPVILTPGEAQGGDLSELLARRLAEALPALRGEAELAPLAHALRESPRQAWDLSIRRALHEIDEQGRARLVLLVDQLEELFTDPAITAVEAECFLRAIGVCVRTGQIWCLATVRSDFFDRCLLTPALVDLMGNDGQFNLLPPDVAALHRIITLPAALAGLRFQAAPSGETLDARILAETANHPEALSLLEYLLRELYEGRSADSRLTQAKYDELGGVEGAFRIRARVALAAGRWQVEAEADDFLLPPGKPLAEAVALLTARPRMLSADLQDYIRRSQQRRVREERRKRLRSQITVAALAALAMVAIGVAVFIHRVRAEQARSESAREEAVLQIMLAETAQREAENAEKMVRRLLALSSIDRGVTQLEHFDRSRGFATLGQAFRHASKVPDMRLSARSLLGSWDFELPGVLPCWAYDAVFSPDGRRIATRGADGKARLWDAATGRPLGVPMKHEFRLCSVAFSPDGTRIVTASADKTARLWDAATGKPLGQPMQHDDFVYIAAFSPDGTRIATASKDETARLWDAATGKPLGAPMKHNAPIWSVVFSPDGTRIATGGVDHSARLWETSTGKPLGSPLNHGEFVHSVAFSPDGGRVVTASKDKTARLWDAATGKPLHDPMVHDDEVVSALFSPDGTRIVTASNDKTVRVWDAATGKRLYDPIKHDGPVWCARFSPDGTRIVTASDDKTAQLWDAATGKPLGQPIKLDAGVNALTFSPDGTRMAITSCDGRVRLSDAAAAAPLLRPVKHDDQVWSVAFSPDGTRIATASKDETARVWDAATGKPLGSPMNHGEAVQSVVFSPDGARIATTGEVSVRLWDAATGRPLGEPMWQTRPGPKLFVAFSPDGKRIATAGSDHTARLWDAATGKPLSQPIKHEGEVNSVAFSPDGTRIATASNDTARFWDAVTGKPLGQPIKHDGGVHSVGFSPDGTRIVTAGDNTARLWDAVTGKPLGQPMQHDAEVWSVVFSPDGMRIATTSRDQTARLWDATTGKPLGQPMQHDAEVLSVVFSNDGRRIATSGADGKARLWDAATRAPLGAPMKHGTVLSVAFSPDGTRIATASTDHTARLWRVPRPLPDDPLWIAAYTTVISGLAEDEEQTLRPVSSETAISKWPEITYSPEWLEYRTSSLEQCRFALHETEAEHWETERNWFAAAFHLRWLCQKDPSNADFQRRLKEADAKQKPTVKVGVSPN